MKEINCCENDTRGHIYNTVFSSYLINGPNKLRCFFTLCWKVMLVKNTLVYWAISKVIKEINCCENDTRGYIYNTSFFISYEWAK